MEWINESAWNEYRVDGILISFYDKIANKSRYYIHLTYFITTIEFSNLDVFDLFLFIYIFSI